MAAALKQLSGRQGAAPAAPVPGRAPGLRCVSRRALICRATQATTQSPTKLRVSLRASDIRSMISMEVIAKGKGQAVVVMEVQAGSPAYEAGVRPGQALVGISDPLRRGELWQLNDRPSLKFINESIKLSRFQEIELEFQDFMNQGAASALAAPTGSMASTTGSMDGSGSGGESSGGSMSMSMDEASGSGRGLTIGERMALEHEKREALKQKASEVKKRIERRAAYMEEVSQRNDSPFLAVVFGFVILPPIIILATAYFSGYLDTMYTNSLTLGGM